MAVVLTLPGHELPKALRMSSAHLMQKYVFPALVGREGIKRSALVAFKVIYGFHVFVHSYKFSPSNLYMKTDC